MSSKRKTAIANKRRGRAFQAKLAELAMGVNIGTLGGEDISHDEFSYEAKTYNINAKTNKNKPWMGEVFLSKIDQGFARSRFALMKVDSVEFDPLILLRWLWWDRLLQKDFITEYSYMNKLYLSQIILYMGVGKFIGNTYMNQAEKNCPDAKLPVAVVHTTGRRHEQDVVLLREIYWQSLLNKILDKII